METLNIRVSAGKEILSGEYASLMAAAGWGDADDFSASAIQRSLAAYPFVAHARDAEGRLVGYISAFSDGAFSTFIGELVVHPAVQRQGVGSNLLATMEDYAQGVPVYVKPFVDSEGFFIKQGYRRAPIPMSVLFKLTSTDSQPGA